MAKKADQRIDVSRGPIEAVPHRGDRPQPSDHAAASLGPKIVPATPRAAAAPDTMLACRYELKYRISECKARALAEYVRTYIKMDRYAQLRPGGEYPITSLYLDSNQLTLCRETLEKKKNRFKLRIRAYSDNPDTPVFFEVKRRLNNVIVKSRARAMHHHVEPVLAGRDMPPVKFKTDMQALHQFQFYVKVLNARPMVLVRYMRQAFEGDGDNRVRVTFDRQLCYNITTEPRVRLGGPGWHPVPVDFVILEIKFTARFPAWLSKMSQAFDLPVTAMSKYASCVRQSMLTGFSAPQVCKLPQLLYS
ncbi:MAG: polyphosphate polymerase domain-containing protein [Sedimentisphaerales bacterium]|nr:polyphosphate polymerase domain-containing protein [Sedimentisphaerales bacterium]